MKQKMFIAALLITTCTLAAEGINAGENDSRVFIAIDQPLTLDTYDLPPFLFTTADDGRHKASITVTLAYRENSVLRKEIEDRKDAIRNSVSMLLSGKNYESLDSVEDVMLLSDEIKSCVNLQLTAGRVMEVYFWDFNID